MLSTPLDHQAGEVTFDGDSDLAAGNETTDISLLKVIFRLTCPRDQTVGQLFVLGHDNVHAPVLAFFGDEHPYHPIVPTAISALKALKRSAVTV